MVGRINPLTLTEHGQLIGLLADYEDHLINKSEELMNNEAPQTEINKCNRALKSVSTTLRIVKNDFSERLKHY